MYALWFPRPLKRRRETIAVTFRVMGLVDSRPLDAVDETDCVWVSRADRLTCCERSWGVSECVEIRGARGGEPPSVGPLAFLLKCNG